MQVNRGKEWLTSANNPLKIGLLKLWHLPDSFSWMEPLPYFHRRGVLLATLLVLVAFLWPGSKSDEPVTRSVPVERSAPNHNGELVNAQIIPPPVNQRSPAVQTPPAEEPVTSANNNQWQEFTIQKGHTLTQLFRENHFIISDAFLLAEVEGSGKPVNSLRIGQKIRVQVTNDKQVTAVEVELAPNRSALFTRQSDGRFRRDR
ncbi:MAG: hypothetical protein LBN41_01675 [Enterobacteriaceae bacterium]|jgi:cell envelope opacity-associated protein A|nr:hypothetical protein [Enterobacteriaceae bacterium]